MLQKVLRQRIAALFVCVAGVLTAIPFAGTQASIQKGQSVAPKFNSVTRVPVGPGGIGANNLAVNSVTNRVYTSNNSSRNVTVLDGTTRAIITNIPVGVGPQGIAVNESTNRVYVANEGTGSVSVIDGAINTVLSSISVGAQPFRIAVNPTTNRIFVACTDLASKNVIFVLDGATNSVIGTAPTQSFPLGIGVNPSTDLVYVACETGVTVLNGTTLAVVANISAIYRPEGIGVNPATNRIYVSNSSNPQVLVIDGLTQTVSATLQSLSGTSNVAVNPTTNRIYFSRPGTGTFAVLDGATNTVLPLVSGLSSGIAVNQVTNQVFTSATGLVAQIDGNTNSEIGRSVIGNNLVSIAVHPILGRVYVLNQSARTVSVLDGKTGALVTTLSVSGTGQFDLVVNPVTNRLYVGTLFQGIQVFDCLTNEFLTTIPAFAVTRVGMVINPVTNLLYTVDNTSGSIKVIDCKTNTLAATIFLSQGSPNELALDLITNRIYAMYTGSVRVIDGYSNTAIATINPVEPHSYQSIAVNPKKNLIYLTNTAQVPHRVSVIDSRSLIQITSIPVDYRPLNIEANSDNNRVYVTHPDSALVTFIDGNTNTVQETSSNVFGPIGTAVDPLGSQAYVPNAYDDTLTIFDEGDENPRAPKVLFFTPNLGLAGTPVTILGKNLGTTNSVTLNGVSVAFTVNSASQLTITIPNNARTGQLVITNSSGSSNAGVFTVIRQK
ncbi:MAG: YncE family protein [Blastocatellia bacterium]|nr:YncE family protein [Blastocatellia bacterium]